MKDKTVLTGIKPTGTPHLGNLVGAITPVIKMSQQAGKTIVFIADLHSLNSLHDPKAINQYTREIAAAFIALGLDPEKTVFFRQSDVPEVPFLMTLLTNITPKGLANRAHAYKAASEKNIAEEKNSDDGINMGLFNYPILMAADILAFGADLVPVGPDQKQHVEIARDIASSLNHLYGKGEQILTVPEAVIQESIDSLPGTDERKMSKSYGNTIPIFGEESKIKKAVMSIKTDARPPSEPKDPESVLIYRIYKAIATQEEKETMATGFQNGQLGYGDAKKILLEKILEITREPRKIYDELLADEPRLDAILERGAQRARELAAPTIAKVSEHLLGHPIWLTQKKTNDFTAITAEAVASGSRCRL